MIKISAPENVALKDIAIIAADVFGDFSAIKIEDMPWLSTNLKLFRYVIVAGIAAVTIAVIPVIVTSFARTRDLFSRSVRHM